MKECCECPSYMYEKGICGRASVSVERYDERSFID